MASEANLPIYILDSFALLAYLEGENAAGRVGAILEDALQERNRVLISIINLGEVIYIIERERGLVIAQEILAAIQQLPVEITPADEEAVFAAAHLKANHRISFADAFAAAAAEKWQGILLTGDPEFKSLDTLLKIEWLIR